MLTAGKLLCLLLGMETAEKSHDFNISYIRKRQMGDWNLRYASLSFIFGCKVKNLILIFVCHLRCKIRTLLFEAQPQHWPFLTGLIMQSERFCNNKDWCHYPICYTQHHYTAPTFKITSHSVNKRNDKCDTLAIYSISQEFSKYSDSLNSRVVWFLF